jgi:hypothetical protein
LCNAGFTECNGACVDTSASAQHCGACDTPCKAGEVCQGGKCESNCGTLTDCGGACVNTTTSLAHCGNCSNACVANGNGTPTCAAGKCGISCNAGFDDCDGQLANGCETNLKTDPAHCGTCKIVCEKPGGLQGIATCKAGACEKSCGGGNTLCNDQCVNTQVDLMNCGTCGNACKNGEVCNSGTCQLTCTAPAKLCNGECVDSSSDPNACGSTCMTCAVPSNGTPKCVNGVCGITCNLGFAECIAGQCLDTQSSSTNCGSCGQKCSGQNTTGGCNQGACNLSCASGFGDCNTDRNTPTGDGCEVNLNTPSNCGGCGRACSSDHVVTPQCSSGLCVSSCQGGYANCNRPPALASDDGCECLGTCAGSICNPVSSGGAGGTGGIGGVGGGGVGGGGVGGGGVGGGGVGGGGVGGGGLAPGDAGFD